MIINGKYVANAWCPHCTFRHPLAVSCQATLDIATEAARQRGDEARERVEHDSNSGQWLPKHDKDFLIGQRVIYASSEIVTVLEEPNNWRQRVRFCNGVERNVDPIKLKPLPGGQL